MAIELSELLTPQVATVAAAVFGGLITVQTTFIKWLVDRFDKLSSAIQDQTIYIHDWMRDHEEKDQSRHEDNLKRFEKITVSLARMGHFVEKDIHGNVIRN